MSELHGAIQAEIDAHTPDRVPSFVALRKRKRARDLRAGAGAVALLVVAVAGVAIAGGNLRQNVDRLPFAGTPSASSAPDPAAVVDACVGRERVQPADGYVGLPEHAAVRRAAQEGYRTRVVARDGQCLPRSDDLDHQRVNFVVTGGLVSWAGRF